MPQSYDLCPAKTLVIESSGSSREEKSAKGTDVKNEAHVVPFSFRAPLTRISSALSDQLSLVLGKLT